MKIYIDSEYRCHSSNLNAIYKEVETDFFNDKCSDFIEGYRFVPAGESWTRSDGKVFHGEMITPWKPYNELDAVQREYEKRLLLEYEATIAELDAALLDAQYINLVEGL